MMFHSLRLLLHKILLFSHWNIFSVARSRADKPKHAENSERAGAEVTSQLERGDLLEVPRTLFVHFGIYLGDGKVAHLIPDILPLLTRDELRVRAVVSNRRLLLGVLSRRAAVRVDTFEDFVYGARVLLINAMDAVLGVQPAPNEEVARAAEKLIGAVRYSLLWNNCEHFVTYCRYGTGISLQTDKDEDRSRSVIRTPLFSLRMEDKNFPSLSETPLLSLTMFLLQFLSGVFTALISDEKNKKKDKKKPQTYDISVFKHGDLLEVPRTLFTHFGIYLGNNRVAHLIPDILPIISAERSAIAKMVTNERLILGVIAKKASVRVDSVEDFAYGAEILVNSMDKVCSRPPLPGVEVARRAEKLMGSMDYSLLWFNCEHYVMFCRYGTSMSFQTYQFCKSIRKLVLSRSSSFLSLVLCVLVTVCLGSVSVCAVLPTLIIPFTIWMAS